MLAPRRNWIHSNKRLVKYEVTHLRHVTLHFQIRNQLEEFEISVYEFPRDEDEAESSDIRAPFAIVGSNTVVEDSKGRRFRVRRYPWGCVNIEDQVKYYFTID